MMIETWDGGGIGYVTHDIAKRAVERWHYSQRVPVSKLVKFGVWEQGRCVGVILYGRGASPDVAGSFGVDQTELAECVRIAMTTHTTPVSQALQATVRALRASQPDLRVLVSFADMAQNHHGGIYQAANWVYTGTTGQGYEIWFGGRWQHDRNLRLTGFGSAPRVRQAVESGQISRADLPRRTTPGKHRYAFPLDRAMRRLVAERSLPYPKPAEEVSTVKQRPSGSQGQVRSLHSAP